MRKAPDGMTSSDVDREVAEYAARQIEILHLLNQAPANYLVGWISVCLSGKGVFTVADLEAAVDEWKTLMYQAGSTIAQVETDGDHR